MYSKQSTVLIDEYILAFDCVYLQPLLLIYISCNKDHCGRDIASILTGLTLVH